MSAGSSSRQSVKLPLVGETSISTQSQAETPMARSAPRRVAITAKAIVAATARNVSGATSQGRSASGAALCLARRQQTPREAVEGDVVVGLERVGDGAVACERQERPGRAPGRCARSTRQAGYHLPGRRPGEAAPVAPQQHRQSEQGGEDARRRREGEERAGQDGPRQPRGGDDRQPHEQRHLAKMQVEPRGHEEGEEQRDHAPVAPRQGGPAQRDAERHGGGQGSDVEPEPQALRRLVLQPCERQYQEGEERRVEIAGADALGAGLRHAIGITAATQVHRRLPVGPEIIRLGVQPRQDEGEPERGKAQGGEVEDQGAAPRRAGRARPCYSALRNQTREWPAGMPLSRAELVIPLRCQKFGAWKEKVSV